MEIKSYNKLYLEDVSENVGSMLEHAVEIGYSPIQFWLYFVNSHLAKEIENGNIKYLVGYSGIDYLDLILKKQNKRIPSIKQIKGLTFNKYYWAGWALTQLQYNTSYSFLHIEQYLTLERVLDLYETLHEADINKFFDIASNYLENGRIETNLKRIRNARALSQSQLSILANVDIRSIQMYEQRKNDINKAQSETLYRISKVLNCRIEDLLETQSF